MAARPVCEILKYVIFHWKWEAAAGSRKDLLEGELLISIEASSSEHQANTFHYVTTKIQLLLSGFSGKLTWPSKEASCSQDLSDLVPFQMTVEVDEKPTTLKTDCLVIKQFLHKTSVVHPKVTFHFSMKVNGVLSKETFGAEKEPIVKLPNGIGLLTDQRHYMRPGSPGVQRVCSRIHPVLGHPVALFIPDEEAHVGLPGELTLTPAAALCPCGHQLYPNQTSRLSTAFVFLYGPSGLPLTFPNQKNLLTVFDNNSYLLDWKKYHLHAVPNLNISLEEDSCLLPDVSYRIESPEQSQPQDSGTEEEVLLLFLFVDFSNGFRAQLTEAWGMQALLLTQLNSILLQNRSLVQAAVHVAVDQALGQHCGLVKAQQKLQASIPVAVSSILSIVAGSTSRSFRALCLETLQAADTQEFRMRLHRAFQQTLLHPSTCAPKNPLPEPAGPEERKDGDKSLEEPVAGSCCLGKAPRLKRCCQGEGVGRRTQADGLGEATQPPVDPKPPCPQAPGWGSPEPGWEDSLWLQVLSNLSERLGGGSGP
uniref:Type 2 DNA topoisomerase 6 subunit B-like n=1 Tax=Monodelphis domestica TaxID=13616 RepID=A0A5F8HB53_MONDO